MAKKPINHSAPYVRSTLTPSATVSRVEAQLDHPSVLSIAYARQWLNAGPGQMGVDVLASGVIRRSLAVYMAHLTDLASGANTDAQQEARAVRSCCSGIKPDEEAREAAYKRLAEHQRGHVLPPYADILRGPHRAAQSAALTARAEELAEEMLQRITRRGSKQ